MNKLIIVFGLFIAFPTFAMELVITKEDSSYFERRLSGSLVSSNKLLADSKITQTNPIYVMLNKISHNFSSCDKDIVKMIKSHSLQYRIDEYKKIEFNPLIQSRLRQISMNHGDIKATWDYIITTRQLLAGTQLEKKQPGFHTLGFDTD